jgi:hypothetical protein
MRLSVGRNPKSNITERRRCLTDKCLLRFGVIQFGFDVDEDIPGHNDNIIAGTPIRVYSVGLIAIDIGNVLHPAVRG